MLVVLDNNWRKKIYYYNNRIFTMGDVSKKVKDLISGTLKQFDSFNRYYKVVVHGSDETQKVYNFVGKMPDADADADSVQDIFTDIENKIKKSDSDLIDSDRKELAKVFGEKDNYNFLFNDEYDEQTVIDDTLIHRTDTIRDVKNKISEYIGEDNLFTPHQYIWLDIKILPREVEKFLTEQYYILVKKSENEFIDYKDLDFTFKRCGWGSLDNYPSLKKSKYQLRDFLDKKMIDIVRELLKHQQISYWTDDNNQEYFSPANPKDFKLIDKTIFNEKFNFNDGDLDILLDLGSIETINVVDLSTYPMDDEFKKIYNPRFITDINKKNYKNDLIDIKIPITKLVDKIYDIREIPENNIESNFDTITFKSRLFKSDKINFKNFLDLSIVFNNIGVSEDIPYIELYDKFIGESVYKLHTDAANVPIIDNEQFSYWRNNKITLNALRLKIKVLNKTLEDINFDIYANVLLYSNSNLEVTIKLNDNIDCESFKKLFYNNIEVNIISVLNKELSSYYDSVIKKDKFKNYRKNIPKQLSDFKYIENICVKDDNWIDIFNSLLDTAVIETKITTNQAINPSLIRDFFDKLFPFVSLVDDNLIKNKKVKFRKTTKSKEYNLKGTIYKQNLNNKKYWIEAKIDGKTIILDNRLRVLYNNNIGIISEIGETTSKVLFDNNLEKMIDNSKLKTAMYEVDIYNIEGTDSSKIKMMYKKISQYAELNKMEKDILNLIDFGYFRTDKKDMTKEEKLRYNAAIKKLSIINGGGISRQEIEKHIDNVKNTTRKYSSGGNKGVLIEFNLEPKIENNKTKFRYTILINDIHNILLMADINTFLINSLKLYDILIDSRERFNDLMENYIEFNKDKNTLELLITKKDEKPEDLVIDSSEEEEDDVLEVSDDLFADIAYDFSDDDDIEDDFSDDGVEETKEGDIKVVDKTDDDDILDYQQNIRDIENKKNMQEILEIELADIVQKDSRMENPAIISKLYEREPGIFKSGTGDERYTRLCQPPQRHPVILTDYEKKQLDKKILNKTKGDGIKNYDILTPKQRGEHESDCKYNPDKYERENPKKDLYKKCSAIRYGSDKLKKNYWFICPEAWCSTCQLSLYEKNIKNNKCPQCGRDVIIQRDNKGQTFPWPSFLKDPNNKGQCMPCCFKPKGKDKLPGDKDIEKIKKCLEVPLGKENKQNKIYIQRILSNLDKNSYSILPSSLNNYFNRFTKNTISKPNEIRFRKNKESEEREYYGHDGKNLIEGFNFYCLRGVDNDGKDDFLAAIADLYNNYTEDSELITRSSLIKIIIDNLSKEDFKTVNNGILPIIFRDIDDRIEAYQNFLEYLVSRDEINYNYLWELLTKKNGWLFKNGLNLVIIDRDNTDKLEFICPKFKLHNNEDKDADYAIIVKYNYVKLF